jgi:hypothetical protein
MMVPTQRIVPTHSSVLEHDSVFFVIYNNTVYDLLSFFESVTLPFVVFNISVYCSLFLIQVPLSSLGHCRL